MSEVERYLDEMFDRLAGTGAAGRRALAETEDHLHAAVAGAMARNVPREQAEHDAVTRFGPSARIARQFRRAQRRGRLLTQSLSGVWLLTGLAAVAAGVSFLASALNIGLMLRIHPEQFPACSSFLTPVCSESVPVMRTTALTGAVVSIVGGALLGSRYLSRQAGLPPVPRRFPLLTAAVFAAGGVVLTVTGWPGGWVGAAWPGRGLLQIQQGPGLRLSIIAGGTAVLCAVAIAAWGIVQARRPRYQQ